MAISVGQKLFDSSGKPVSLKPKPLAVGGEGAIYELVDDPTIVAKVYKTKQSKERSEKLKVMAEQASAALLKVAAWPTATLHTSRGGAVEGILMPRIVGSREIHHLYSVAQRKKDYPEADWTFLIHAAMNCAIAFERIHNEGHVVGDVNQKNVLVSNNATVQFVDCDSFQVRARNGKYYRCSVGVPEYTPPELQGRPFRDIDREPNHDLFGLAVLIFHLVMMGRHPFSGVYQDPGEMPLEKAIQGGRFAYSAKTQFTRMKPPPNSLPLSILDLRLVQLFERAFAPAGHGSAPRRPSPAEWGEALKSFLGQLGICKVDHKHVYPKQSDVCPWCQFLGRSGLFFFLPGTPSVLGRIQFDLMAVWGQIERIPRPAATYRQPTASPAKVVGQPVPQHIPPPTPKPATPQLPSANGEPDTFFDRLAGAGILVGLILSMIAPPVGAACIVWFGVWLVVLLSTRGQRRAALRKARELERQRILWLTASMIKAWERENSEWCQEHTERKMRLGMLIARVDQREWELKERSDKAVCEFESVLKRLETSKVDYGKAKDSYSRDVADSTKRSPEIQLERHLDSHLIRDAKIKAMTTDRILSLSSFGIETAADVGKLGSQKVPGIGPVLTRRLREWRDSLSRSFTARPGLPSEEKAVIDQRHLPRLRQLERVLLDGPRQLKEISSRYDSEKKSALARIGETVGMLSQAQSDVEIMDKMLPKQSS